jgi:hypothetical protein
VLGRSVSVRGVLRPSHQGAGGWKAAPQARCANYLAFSRGKSFASERPGRFWRISY